MKDGCAEMALISELVTELSVMSGIPERSVAVIARHLREAGLLSQKGRGRGAARATALDAARLCIALMIDGKAKDAPDVVRDFGQLRSGLAGFEPDSPFSAFSLEETCGLADGHTFEDALAGLIDIWGRPDIVERMDELSRPTGMPPTMIVRLRDHTVSGEIFFGIEHHYYNHEAMLRAVLTEDSSDDFSEAQVRLIDEYLAVSLKYASGIRSAREICAVEIRPLGEVVAGLRAPGYRESIEDLTASWLRAWKEVLERDAQDLTSASSE